MKKIKFSDLSWPKGLNLHLLIEFLSEDKLMKLIMAHVDDDRETREIILPSRKTAKKVFAHWLAKQHKNRQKGFRSLACETTQLELGRCHG